MTRQATVSISKLPPRRLEDLNLMDDFLFQEMLMQEDTGEEFCRILFPTNTMKKKSFPNACATIIP